MSGVKFEVSEVENYYNPIANSNKVVIIDTCEDKKDGSPQKEELEDLRQ